MREPSAETGLSRAYGAGSMALWAMCLIAAVALLTGCESAEHRDELSVPLPRADLAYDFEQALRDSEPRPPLLAAEAAPYYKIDRIPLRPPAIGRLDVPLKRKWKYIVIHHGSSDSGSMKAFDAYHKKRGWLGVGYHFVIGNGTQSEDGIVEVTFRWHQQLHGAHAGKNRQEYNQHGIGICLVGNFQNDRPTEKQMVSLISLVNYLQERCKIPTGEIMLHRHLRATDCPGEDFPFYKLLSLLPH
ncbi:MAG: peptidoglycan recognition family protein [Candidatus Brocadiia bacterium]|nr:peptidoglycan recognition family protein [Candidatus Brocadiia bacterium]